MRAYRGAVTALGERAPGRSCGQLRVAVLAPPWIPVPPSGYGGIEAVVALLCDALVERGHAVTLFGAPGSTSSAAVVSLLDRPHPEAIERALFEADHVARAFELIDGAAASGDAFDVVHDHCGFTAFAMADRLDTPLVHTLHGPFTPETYAFYRCHSRRACVVAISNAQLAQGPSSLRVAGVVPNPIKVSRWPFQAHKEGYLLWIGRMTEEKGPHRAIAVAREAGRRLVIAGPIQPGQQPFFDREIAPQLDDQQIRYVGEVGGIAKQRLFAGADALLMPIRWPEPFGMVMIEAMVCGTPVIAFPEGSAVELVRNGETGFLVADEHEMAVAVDNLAQLDPRRCRASVAARYDINIVAAAYEQVYASITRPRLSASAPEPEPVEPSLHASGGRSGSRAAARALGQAGRASQLPGVVGVS
ncbi:MAG: glycosyltransferase family 4 protein [Actinomycetota bacterium]|nr:glycosyltransferase family 4 protein [Actinomycetota bacterium]